MHRRLSASICLAALLSVTGGIVGHGIYFLAHSVWQFDDQKNLLLAGALWLPYVPMALLAGPLSARFGSPKVLGGLTLLMILCGIGLGLKPPEAGLWLLAPLYNGAAGMAWPLIEAGVSRGRQGADLSRAVGLFNLTWAITLIPGLWVVDQGGSLPVIFGILIALHLCCFPLLWWMGGTQAIAVPEVGLAAWQPLLRSARILLPLSYLLLDGLVPLLPGRWEALGVAHGAAWTPLWMVARVGIFALMIRFPQWHGKRWPLVLGMILLIIGFATVLAAPSAWSMGIGLLAFGMGHGLVYYNALYYGMALGHGDSAKAGGWHEAMIGLGYLSGPLLAALGYQLGVGPVPVVGAVVLLGGGMALRELRPGRA